MRCYLSKDEFINTIFDILKARGLNPIKQSSKRLNKERQLTFVLTANSPSKVIYIKDYYEAYLKGKPFSDIIEDIVSSDDEELGIAKKISKYPLEDWNKMKGCIRSRVFSASFNKEIAQKNSYPYIRTLDLIETFYIKFDDTNEMYLPITSELMNVWNIDIDDLSMAAHNNLSSDRFCIRNISDVIFETQNEIDVDDDLDYELVDSMLILKLKHDQLFGAVAILNFDLLSKIFKRLNSCFYILPSSVHELIIVPVEEIIEEQYLAFKSIVIEANTTTVPDGDILSSSVYYFDGNSVKIIV